MDNTCNRCGETVSDLDAGFSPAVSRQHHACGGAWRRMEPSSSAREDRRIVEDLLGSEGSPELAEQMLATELIFAAQVGNRRMIDVTDFDAALRSLDA